MKILSAIGVIVSGLLHVLGAPRVSQGTYGLFKGVYGGLYPLLLQPSMICAILGRASLVRARAG